MMPVSKTQTRAIAFAKQHENKITRHPGGFWAGPEFRRQAGKEWFGTSTVQALVNRGLMEYSEWRGYKGRPGQYPIEATLTEKGL